MCDVVRMFICAVVTNCEDDVRLDGANDLFNTFLELG
jgi:hypothetical protein